MKFQRLLWLLPVGAAVLAGCHKSPAAGSAPEATPEIDPVYLHLTHAQPRLPTVKIWLGDQELTAEIARRDIEIRTGMMYRTNMPDNEAMLFVFSNTEMRSFYMRNCFIPLSGAYINPDGEILEIIKMEPHNETGIPSKSKDIQYVLELPQGWFDRHHLGVGAVVTTQHGSLQKTFFGR